MVKCVRVPKQALVVLSTGSPGLTDLFNVKSWKQALGRRLARHDGMILLRLRLAEDYFRIF